MLKELKFVQGAVAAKDYVPSLQHYKISDGRVSGYNGVLALSTPIDLDIEAMPKATQFAKAIERLPDKDGVVLDLTKAGRLLVKSSGYRVHVDCWPEGEAYPLIAPAGERVALPAGILPVLRVLAPFMSIDESRPWSRGILLTGQSAFATNNLIVAELWAGIVFPSPINIPAVAVKEMLRIGEEPVALQLEASAVTFHYENGAWLKTALLSTEWPELSPILERPHDAVPLPENFFEEVRRLEPFAEKSGFVYLSENKVSTSTNEGDGASVDLENFAGKGSHHLKQLLLLEGVAEKIDLSQWPMPCLFFGENLRGAIVGQRS